MIPKIDVHFETYSLVAPFEDLKKEYCALSLEGKREMLARESISGQQADDLLSIVR